MKTKYNLSERPAMSHPHRISIILPEEMIELEVSSIKHANRNVAGRNTHKVFTSIQTFACGSTIPSPQHIEHRKSVHAWMGNGESCLVGALIGLESSFRRMNSHMSLIGLIGIAKKNVAPSPTAPFAHTLPPCRSTILCTRARPTPVPGNSSSR